jgi:glycosyltransferase involved in cell wall biosynthesis
MPIISFISPVFNVKPFLPSCRDSIIGQPFNDWEWILVDNGSTDGSSDLCDEYAAADQRISVVHQGTNEGPGPARNVGLSMAKGEYIYFVDSDDCLAKEVLFDLVNTIRNNNSPDLVYVPCLETYDPTSERVQGVPCKPSPEPGFSGPFGLFLDGFAMGDKTGFQVWMLFIKRRLIETHKLRFHPFRMGEDIDFTMRVLCLAKDFCTYDRTFYYWRQSYARSFIATYAPHGWAFILAATSMLTFAAERTLDAIRIQFVFQNVQNYLEHFERRFIAGISESELVDQLPYLENLVRLIQETNFPPSAEGLIKRMLQDGARKGATSFRCDAIHRNTGYLRDFRDRDLFIIPASKKTSWLAWIIERNGYRVKGLMDNDVSKTGLIMDGYTIYSPTMIPSHCSEQNKMFVIISTSRVSTAQAITDQMTSYGLSEGEHFARLASDLN